MEMGSLNDTQNSSCVICYCNLSLRETAASINGNSSGTYQEFCRELVPSLCDNIDKLTCSNCNINLRTILTTKTGADGVRRRVRQSLENLFRDLKELKIYEDLEIMQMEKIEDLTNDNQLSLKEHIGKAIDTLRNGHDQLKLTIKNIASVLKLLVPDVSAVPLPQALVSSVPAPAVTAVPTPIRQLSFEKQYEDDHTRWRNQCKDLLDEVYPTNDAVPFQTPLNHEEYPDYYEVIKTPMDLRKVNMKLNRGEYISPFDFHKDMDLIFKNSLQYNTDKKSKIYSMTTRFQALYESKVRPILLSYKNQNRKEASKAVHPVLQGIGPSTSIALISTTSRTNKRKHSGARSSQSSKLHQTESSKEKVPEEEEVNDSCEDDPDYDEGEEEGGRRSIKKRNCLNHNK